MITRIFRSFGAAAGYLAALANAVAFVWYGLYIWSGEAVTNPVTWMLWLGETAVSLSLYADRTRDRPKWMAEAVSMVGVVGICGLLGAKAAMGDLQLVLAAIEPIDVVIAIITVMVFKFWLGTRKMGGAGAALWAFQIALILAIAPLARSTYADPSAEPFWPWALWTVTFGLQTLCAWWRWDGWTPLLNPINYALTHAIVAGIVWYGTMP